MPSSGVEKPLILSDNLEDNFIWSVTKGIHSDFPDYIEGDNSLSLSYVIDRLYEMYRYYSLQRLDKRHVSVDTIDSLNDEELNDGLERMGVPFIRNDPSTTKKRRLRNWWKNNNGGGTKSTIKSTIYNYIGSGVFYDYDTQAGKDDPADTNRIIMANPTDNSRWGDYPSIEYTEWGNSALGSGSEDSTWGDYNAVGLQELDIQIYYRKLKDWYKWEVDSRKSDLLYLIDEIKPAGLIYTISNIYDGDLNTTATSGTPGLYSWVKMNGSYIDETDNYSGTETNTNYISGLNNYVLDFGTGTPNAYILYSGTSFSGTKLSLSTWINVPDNAENYPRLFNANSNLQIFGNTDFNSGIRTSSNNYSTFNLTSSGVIFNQWTHIVITLDIDNNTAKTYYDGEIVGSTTETMSGTFVFDNYYIGTNVGDDGFDGKMKDWKIYNKIISDDDVKELYSGINQFT